MATGYDPQSIEPKWQAVWAEERTWHVSNDELVSLYQRAWIVSSASIRRRATSATSSIAELNAASFAFEGALKPLSLRTNCSDAARISSWVAGGLKLKSVLMLRHMDGFL